MPCRDLAALTDSDVDAVVDSLKSLPPVRHQVSGPFGPQEKPEIFRMVIVPPSDADQAEGTP